mmetsp:Transcript_11211/g.31018  ORF Transcript_11211/g.31018 Transcript_11211/m.31018 type:complete len:295 (+) Transcript_11211:984-1868(+)
MLGGVRLHSTIQQLRIWHPLGTKLLQESARRLHVGIPRSVHGWNARATVCIQPSYRFQWRYMPRNQFRAGPPDLGQWDRRLEPIIATHQGGLRLQVLESRLHQRLLRCIERCHGDGRPCHVPPVSDFCCHVTFHGHRGGSDWNARHLDNAGTRCAGRGPRNSRRVARIRVLATPWTRHRMLALRLRHLAQRSIGRHKIIGRHGIRDHEFDSEYWPGSVPTDRRMDSRAIAGAVPSECGAILRVRCLGWNGHWCRDVLGGSAHRRPFTQHRWERDKATSGVAIIPAGGPAAAAAG